MAHRIDRSTLLGSAALALALAGCGGGGGGSSGGAPAAAPVTGTTSSPTGDGTTPLATGGSTTPTTTPPPVTVGTPTFAAAANDDPSWYATPRATGAGARTVSLTPGGSQTLQQAMDAARPGDVIELASGSYSPTTYSTLLMTSSGSSSAWITIRPAAGASPVIDLRARGELRISGSYILLEGLEVVNGGGNNIHVCPTASSITNVVVSGCYVHRLATGAGAAVKINSDNSVGASCSYVYVEGCNLTDAIDNSTLDCVGVSRCVARGNDIHDNQVGMHGLFYKGGSSDILIERNLVRGIRQNAALQLGGNTEMPYFTPAHRDREGVNYVVRNNIIADCDDSVFEIRGLDGAKIYHNTVITQTSFTIFRFSYGSSAVGPQTSSSPDFGQPSRNSNVDIANNLIISTSASPLYAENDANSGAWTFGPQLWAGGFSNNNSNGVPSFPGDGDMVESSTGGILVSASYAGLSGIEDAISRFELHAGSPALGAGEANTVAPRDFIDQPRHAQSPSIGAFE